MDRSLVTLIALGRLIETIGVKRTLEITNKRANYHVDLERASLQDLFLAHLTRRDKGFLDWEGRG